MKLQALKDAGVYKLFQVRGWIHFHHLRPTSTWSCSDYENLIKSNHFILFIEMLLCVNENCDQKFWGEPQKIFPVSRAGLQFGNDVQTIVCDCEIVVLHV